MKSLALTFAIILSAFLLPAQDYIKFTENTEIEGRKFFKDEIYQQIVKNKILFGKDTINLDGAKITKLKANDLNKLNDTINFIINSDNLNYSINVKEYINLKDTIKLVCADNRIIPFVTKDNAKIEINKCGSPFRLIIPGYPSKVFYDNEISKPETVDNLNPNDTEYLQREETLMRLLWWHYLIGGILFLIISYFVYPFIWSFFFEKKKYPIREKYNGEDFIDFAIKFKITRDKLFKYNSDEFEKYKSNLSPSEKKSFKTKLKGKSLIIGYSKYEEQTPGEETNNEVNDNLNDSLNTEELLSQIQRMENKILNKIESLASNKEASQKIENQQKEIERLKGQITQLNNDIERKNHENNVRNNELSQVLKKKHELENEFSKYSEKVIFVDYLEPYAKATYDYYNFCLSGYDKAIEYFNKLNNTGSDDISIVSQLLVKFISSIPNKTNHWVGVINEIKDSKTTANIELIRSLKQLPNNEEKNKEFKRILLKDVFEKYSSAFLILTEELSNLSKFTNDSSQVVNDMEYFFKSFKSELHNKIKVIGLDLNYVPLFEHYAEYAAFTKLANKNCSLPYKKVNNISKDYVLEIINYGFGNEETNVILA